MLKNLQKALDDLGFEGLLITSPQNRRYATGFHSTAGVCLITKEKGYFFTDFRYIEAAKQNIHGFEVVEIHGGQAYAELINKVTDAEGIRALAFEDNALTYADVKRWKRGLTAEMKPMGDLIADLRQVKTPAELDNVIAAQRIAERALTETLNDIKAGVTEKEIAARLTYFMLIYGGENMSFDPIVVSGKKSSMPHGVPSDKKIENGDFVTMDFGCIYNGYCSDMTRTIAVASATDEMEQVYNLVLEAQKAGIATAKAGIPGKNVDAAGRKVIENGGYGDFFGHGFGHGIGIDIHEMPNAGPNSQNILPAGAIISAEPGIYLPNKFGVRIEDMLFITESGCRNLTDAPKKLIILK